MKNILLLTSVYPADDLPKDNTPVVHYFAKEWVSQGYNVTVIHNKVYYPALVHFLIRKVEKLISKYYQFNFPTQQKSKSKSYNLEGVNVFRIPIFKWLPQLLFTKKTKEKQLAKIIQIIDSINLKPDAIIGHWVNPQLFLVTELGKIYYSKTCLVMHSDVSTIRKIYNSKATDIIQKIDVWGFRSVRIREKFENLYGRVDKPFLCYSGIPSNKINLQKKTFENGIKKFIFVGLLIPRKHPTALIKAVNRYSHNKDFQITFIGEGPEKENILGSAKKLNITEKISLLGRIPREEVFKKLKDADCFIMVSQPETLGLVYIEAMSMGCITIGSKNEGIDGIIAHGLNGFLCNPGDYKELSEVLKEISAMSNQELTEVSKNAVNTAKELTDRKVASRYIDSVFQN